MKRASVILTILLICGVAVIAQPSKTKAKTQKSMVKKQEPLIMPMMIKKEDGSSEYFDLNRGDQLVYHVNESGKEYDFIVTINDNSYKKGIDFSYEMTDPVNRKGHVTISSKAKDESSKYVNYFSGGEMKLTDACTVWLTGKNFGEMPDKKTTMTIDNNAPEVFYRPEADEVSPIVKIKGKEMKIDGFMISNAQDGKGSKTLWINGISSNPLILKMDLGWTIELKEIR